MARYASEAERLRAHREAFTLALQLGCTPREAERELRRRKRKRMDACGTRAPAEQPEIESTEDLVADLSRALLRAERAVARGAAEDKRVLVDA